MSTGLKICKSTEVVFFQSEHEENACYWDNKNMNDFPGEKWKEIPGTDGNYVISNLGRVKCFDRTVINKRGVSSFYKGRIMQQVVIRYQNNTMGDHIPELVTNVSFCGNRIRIRIARMVYELFVANQNNNTSQPSYVVMHKNRNRYDNRAVNLQAASYSEKTTDTYNNDRMQKVYQFITSKSIKLNAERRQKKVTGYNGKGICIGIFKSIKEAAIKTGIPESSIVAALKGIKIKKAGGIFWQYGSGEVKIDTGFYDEHIEKSMQKKKQPVTQFNSLGYPLNTYNSIREAAAQVGGLCDGISKVINNKASSYYGFFWRKGRISYAVNIAEIKKTLYSTKIH